MFLLGKHELNPPESDFGLIASMFERLPKEVQFEVPLTRFVGFESTGQGANRIRFFGIETEAIENLSGDLEAWELEGTSWKIWRARNGCRTAAWQEEIEWRWQANSCFGRFVGEFTARGPEEWRVGSEGGRRTFELFANAPYDLRSGGLSDNIGLVDYNPTWPEQFERMAAWLRDRMGNTAIRIEHYGSTAIPSMPAKPILDLLVQIPSFEEGKRIALTALSDETWEYWWYVDHLIFIKRNRVMGERTHHLHMAPRGLPVWEGIAFRDYLRSHPDDAARYVELKYRLAETYRNDREGYTQAKTAFVNEILQKEDPFSEQKRLFHLEQFGKRAGWDDPEMDVYNNLDPRRK
jgi:GrpB-like predicted nucleotidyltransferase (UPF0157 family)